MKGAGPSIARRKGPFIFKMYELNYVDSGRMAHPDRVLFEQSGAISCLSNIWYINHIKGFHDARFQHMNALYYVSSNQANASRIVHR